MDVPAFFIAAEKFRDFLSQGNTDVVPAKPKELHYPIIFVSYVILRVSSR